MQISVFGIIYIILSLFFCIKKKWFTYWFVFSNSLFYTSVFIVGSVDIKPYFLATLIMFFVFVRGEIFSRNSFKHKDVSSLLLFAIWIFISFPFTFFLTNVNVIPADAAMSDYTTVRPLNASWKSLDVAINPAFNVFSYFVIRAYIKTTQDVKDFTRGYLISFIPLVITVSILFILRNVIHQPALTQAFFSFINPSYTRNVAGNKWGAIGDIARTFTYVGEASFTAKYYLIMLSLFAGFLLYRQNNVRQRILLLGNILLILLLITVLGSTTGYIGFLFLLIIIWFLYFRYKHAIAIPGINNNGRFIFFVLFLSPLTLIPIALIFYNEIAFFIDYLLINHVNKIEGEAGSGYSRIQTNLIALEVFIRSPLFGVGYGQNRATTFLTFLLSNVGIVGFVLFNFFWLYLIIIPLKKLKSMPKELKMHCMIYITMFIITYLVNFLFSSSVAIAFGWVWANAALLGRLADWRSLDDYSKNEYGNNLVK